MQLGWLLLPICGKMAEKRALMANLTIEVSDELARGLEGIAAAQRKTLQQLALEQLTALIAIAPEFRAGSPPAILRVMREQPHPTSEDVDALDTAIASGRLPIHSRDLF